MSIVNAIEEGLSRHLTLYKEKPQLVLVGPEELYDLIEEVAAFKILNNGQPFSIFNMIVVAKCGNGIDFQVSCETAKLVIANNNKQSIANVGN